ncbi:threonine-phosphate decarboxylase CobD [Pararhizobium sp.]|uniref:threonine-phosphate decarboxylase CobD n=1 Tax=Pararhizobium sp. TaxID=1977563 RepID=UPI0027278E7D|nr:threonine-phosphate decarboxylase CobD [Pararhizobium sp.]MDO9418679.1 threonine-phosphate decarboxylase CobD [Pararhizobium sp.]
MTMPIVHGGGVAAAARLFGGQPQDWLDLSTGINPNGVPLPVIPASVWQRLPDRDLFDVARIAAAGYYRSAAVLPLPVPGTQSVIQLLPRLVPAGRRVAIFSPTYGEYARAFTAAGLAVDAIADPAEITAAHGLVVVVNPNNPDGRAFAPAEIESMLDRVRTNGGSLVVDEAFGDTQPGLSVVPSRGGSDGLIVLRSFGKFFGLAGLRLGFVMAPDPILDGFQDWLGPWAVSGPALTIAAGLMGRDTGMIQSGIAARKAGLDSVLVRAGLRIVGGTALFSLVEHEAAGDIHAALCRAHILVRKFDYNGRWLRFGLAPDTAGDQRLLQALQTHGF